MWKFTSEGQREKHRYEVIMMQIAEINKGKKLRT